MSIYQKGFEFFVFLSLSLFFFFFFFFFNWNIFVFHFLFLLEFCFRMRGTACYVAWPKVLEMIQNYENENQ